MAGMITQFYANAYPVVTLSFKGIKLGVVTTIAVTGVLIAVLFLKLRTREDIRPVTCISCFSVGQEEAVLRLLIVKTM